MTTFALALIAACVGALAGWALERWIISLPPEEYPRERPIPARGVTVPVVGALLLGYIGWRFANQPLLVLLLGAYTLFFLAIFVTDFETRWIFSSISYAGLVVALLASFIDPRFNWRLALLGAAIAFGFFGLAWLMGRKAFGPGAFGRGDVTLGVFMGLTSGFPAIILAILIGVVANGLIALLLLVVYRSSRIYMPYGPFLCIGGWIGMVWGEQLMKIWLRTP
jgi:leader peptidase (prepilin peptidase)/N-methyltransferase